MSGRPLSTKKPRASKWTDTEIARLRSLAIKVRIDDVTRILKRSRGAISAKVFMLRLSLDVKPDR